jgi:hypothetical protein
VLPLHREQQIFSGLIGNIKQLLADAITALL